MGFFPGEVSRVPHILINGTADIFVIENNLRAHLNWNRN